MKIETFNNRGSAHLVDDNNVTLCGRKWPGSQGKLKFREPQLRNYPRGRHIVAHPNDGNVYLCGNCEKVVEARGYVDG